MTVQIFGRKKSSDTRKAERFFSERGIKYQYIDMNTKGMSRGELTSVAGRIGLRNLIDESCRDKELIKLMEYISDDAVTEKMLDNPQVIKVPVVRNGKEATCGYQPEVWKEWDL